MSSVPSQPASCPRPSRTRHSQPLAFLVREDSVIKTLLVRKDGVIKNVNSGQFCIAGGRVRNRAPMDPFTYLMGQRMVKVVKDSCLVGRLGYVR